MALSRLGQSPITEFGQDQGTGLVMKSNYGTERDSLLRKAPWNFARIWISLAQLAGSPLGLDINPNQAGPGSVIYTGAYQLPLDFIRLVRFSPRTSHWRIVGKAIYTDATPPSFSGTLLGLQPLGSDGADNQPSSSSTVIAGTIGIEYVAQITNSELFDSLFVDVLVWKLVKDLSFGVTALTSLYRQAAKEYEDGLAEAKFVNGAEQLPDEFWNTNLTDVRYGYSGLTFGA
jgi:hypothetical protein